MKGVELYGAGTTGSVRGGEQPTRGSAAVRVRLPAGAPKQRSAFSTSDHFNSQIRILGPGRSMLVMFPIGA